MHSSVPPISFTLFSPPLRFYNKDITDEQPVNPIEPEEGEDTSGSGVDTDTYFFTSTGLVFRWKLWATIYVASIGVGMNLLTLLVHFDTVVLPKLWVCIFRDGSLAERNLILFMILFWAGGVHICTSSLSVGEAQANVYFTAWIGKRIWIFFSTSIANLSQLIGTDLLTSSSTL